MPSERSTVEEARGTERSRLSGVTVLGVVYRQRKVFHMCWASESSSKLIPIHEESNHQIVHLFRLGKAQRTTH